MDPNPANGPMLEQFLCMLGDLFRTIGLGEHFARSLKSMMEKAPVDLIIGPLFSSLLLFEV